MNRLHIRRHIPRRRPRARQHGARARRLERAARQHEARPRHGPQVRAHGRAARHVHGARQRRARRRAEVVVQERQRVRLAGKGGDGLRQRLAAAAVVDDEQRAVGVGAAARVELGRRVAGRGLDEGRVLRRREVAVDDEVGAAGGAGGHRSHDRLHGRCGHGRFVGEGLDLGGGHVDRGGHDDLGRDGDGLCHDGGSRHDGGGLEEKSLISRLLHSEQRGQEPTHRLRGAGDRGRARDRAGRERQARASCRDEARGDALQGRGARHGALGERDDGRGGERGLGYYNRPRLEFSIGDSRGKDLSDVFLGGGERDVGPTGQSGSARDRGQERGEVERNRVEPLSCSQKRNPTRLDSQIHNGEIRLHGSGVRSNNCLCDDGGRRGRRRRHDARGRRDMEHAAAEGGRLTVQLQDVDDVLGGVAGIGAGLKALKGGDGSGGRKRNRGRSQSKDEQSGNHCEW